MELWFVSSSEKTHIRAISVHGMLWLQTQFEDEYWEPLASHKILLPNEDAKDLTKEDHKRLKGNVEAIMQKGSYSKNELLTEVGERIKQLQKRS